MGDKVTRQLLKVSDGKPSTGKIVKLRPAETIGTGSDIELPETPSGSGIYRSANEVPHGVWKEVINGTETGETLSVEPGRACYAIYTDKTKTALIDRLMTDVVRLSGFVEDAVDLPTSTNLRDAMIHAMTYRKTLVMTDDATLASGISLGSYDLYVDLNGKTLTLNANISCNKAFICNGKISLMTGAQSVSAAIGTAWQDVEFLQGGSTQVTANPDDRYINVRGMPTTIPGTAATKPIVVGCAGAPSVDRLSLTFTKLSYLQNFVDSLYTNLLAVHDWLTSSKRTLLDRFANAPTATTGAFANGDFQGNTANFQTLAVETIVDAPRVGTDSSGTVIPSGRDASSSFSQALGTTFSTVLNLNTSPLTKKFISLTNANNVNNDSVAIQGSPAGGSCDVVYIFNPSTSTPMIQINGGNIIELVPNEMLIIVWDYAGNKWFRLGGI